MTMPQKMRQSALKSALSTRLQDGSITIVSGFANVEPKTKAFVETLKNLQLHAPKKKVLLVLPQKTENLQRAAGNVEGVSYVNANQLNTYEVLNAKNLLFMKEALETVEKTLIKGEK